MKLMKKIVITLFIMLALSACSKPIPADKFAYIGYWQGPGMYLEILPDGTFDYQRGGTSDGQWSMVVDGVRVTRTDD